MKVLFRLDAGARMGTGHAMRCLALAQAVGQSGGESFFLSSSFPEGLKQRFQGEPCTLLPALDGPACGGEDARETARRAAELGVGWVVVDGYGFDAHYQDSLKEHGAHVLFIDDYGHCKRYCADIVLNQNVSAHEGLYAEREASTRLLLGTPYVLLRQEFLAHAGRGKSVPRNARRILVTLGGGDPDNVTGKVLRALAHLRAPDLRVTAVIGGSNPHREDVERAVRGLQVPAECRINATDMPHLMAEADLAIAAGGTTSYELAFMGLPSLCIVIADNQREIATGMEREGVVQALGWHADLSGQHIADAAGALLHDAPRRSAMSGRGRALIDGRGTERVLEALQDGARANITLRQATEDDCRMLWEWANDPAVRASSFSPAEIPWERHRDWFQGRLRDPACRIVIALDGKGIPVGQIRFNIREDGMAEVDVNIAPNSRGRGYGQALIREGSRGLFASTDASGIDAFVKTSNSASHKAFLAAGFREAGRARMKGYEVYHLTLHRP